MRIKEEHSPDSEDTLYLPAPHDYAANDLEETPPPERVESYARYTSAQDTHLQVPSPESEEQTQDEVALQEQRGPRHIHYMSGLPNGRVPAQAVSAVVSSSESEKHFPVKIPPPVQEEPYVRYPNGSEYPIPGQTASKNKLKRLIKKHRIAWIDERLYGKGYYKLHMNDGAILCADDRWCKELVPDSLPRQRPTASTSQDAAAQPPARSRGNEKASLWKRDQLGSTAREA